MTVEMTQAQLQELIAGVLAGAGGGAAGAAGPMAAATMVGPMGHYCAEVVGLHQLHQQGSASR